MKGIVRRSNLFGVGSVASHIARVDCCCGVVTIYSPVQILIHELGHYVFRKYLVFRLSGWSLALDRWYFASKLRGAMDSNRRKRGPGMYCLDIPVSRSCGCTGEESWQTGFDVAVVTEPNVGLCDLIIIWSNPRVVVFREKRTMTDGAWIALLRGGFRLPEGFDPCTEDSGVEGTHGVE